jgi:hypothetical protein
LSTWEEKTIKQNVASLPRGAVGKGAFAEGFLGITLGNSGKNLPSSGVSSFAERSCTALSAKNFFLKK